MNRIDIVLYLQSIQPSKVYSHLMQIYFKNPQALFHITTLFHFAVS